MMEQSITSDAPLSVKPGHFRQAELTCKPVVQSEYVQMTIKIISNISASLILAISKIARLFPLCVKVVCEIAMD